MHQRKRWVSKMYPISSKVIFILQINMWWILDSVLKVVFLQYIFSVKNFSELVCLRFERPHSVQLFSCRFCRKDPETFASTIEIVDNNGGVRGFSLCGYKQPRKTHDSNFCSLILLMQKGVDFFSKFSTFCWEWQSQHRRKQVSSPISRMHFRRHKSEPTRVHRWYSKWNENLYFLDFHFVVRGGTSVNFIKLAWQNRKTSCLLRFCKKPHWNCAEDTSFYDESSTQPWQMKEKLMF